MERAREWAGGVLVFSWCLLAEYFWVPVVLLLTCLFVSMHSTYAANSSWSHVSTLFRIGRVSRCRTSLVPISASSASSCDSARIDIDAAVVVVILLAAAQRSL